MHTENCPVIAFANALSTIIAVTIEMPKIGALLTSHMIRPAEIMSLVYLSKVPTFFVNTISPFYLADAYFCLYVERWKTL